MPTGFNERRQQLFHRVLAVGGGLNSTSPVRTLAEGEASYLWDTYPKMGRLEPCKRHTDVVYDLSATANQIVYHMYVYEGAVAWLCMFCDTKVYVDNTGTPVDKTPSTPFTSTTHHRYEAYTMLTSGSPVAVCNNFGTDKPHYWDGGGGLFLILTDSYKGKCCVPFLGSLFMGHSFESSTWYPNRLRWSDSGDITAWSGITSGWYDLENEGDEIRRLGVLGRILWAFRKNTVYRIPPTGNFLAPIEDHIYAGRGLAAPFSLQRIEEAGFLFLSDDDVYLCGPSVWQGVGSRIRKELFATADPAKLLYAWSALDPREKRYYLVTDMKDATVRAWIYNYEENNWTMQDFTGYSSLIKWVKV